MNVLDLFSGIGGFSLGLERAGFKTVAFCEIEPYCQAVLRKHWPNIPIYEDVRKLTAQRLRTDGISVDVVCGGFPCQDISTAGKGAGIEGERSGLWTEFARLISELRPRYAIVENVSVLLGRGLSKVLGDLAAIGFDAEWHCIPASAVGAPHRRDRVWIIAYPAGSGLQKDAAPIAEEEGSANEKRDSGELSRRFSRSCSYVANSTGERCQERRKHRGQRAERSTGGGEVLADAGGARTRVHAEKIYAWESELGGSGDMADSDFGDKYRRRSIMQMGWERITRKIAQDGDTARIQWSIEPNVGRVAHGVPARVDRLKALGNAVVPQIPEIIGRAIMAGYKPDGI